MIYIGFFLLFIGLVIKAKTILSLGRNTTWRIEKPHVLVKNGIYKYIRHPLYLGELTGYFGLSLVLTQSVGISVMLFITILKFFMDRIDREEKLLLSVYGKEYEEYFNKTKMLIPFLI